MHFIGDQEQHGPNTVTEWKTKLTEMKTEMGLPEFHPINRIIEVFNPIQYPKKEESKLTLTLTAVYSCLFFLTCI